MPEAPTNVEAVRENVRATQAAVLPRGGSGEGDASSPPAYEQSIGKTVQAVGLSTAIVIQDAADMLRNVSTVQVTAIGAATAAWIATRDPSYEAVIDKSMAVLKDAVGLYLSISQNAFNVLAQFEK
jgi:hypothetical protein